VPLFAIGEDSAARNLELFGVVGIVRLGNGRIVVANAGTNELRYFTATGQYLCSTGRTGAGPGEFENLAWIQALPGDTLAAYQVGGGGRLSLFDHAGQFVRSERRPVIPSLPFITPLWIFPEGESLMRSGRSFSPGLGSGTYRDTVTFVVGTSDSVLAVLGVFAGAETVVVAREGSVDVRGLPYSRNVVWAANSQVIAVGSTDRFEISIFRPDGHLLRLVRLTEEPRRLTSALKERAESTILASMDNAQQKARIERFFEQASYPSTLPAFGHLRIDERGYLWVSHYSVTAGPRAWKVFDPEGTFLGSVLLPASFLPRHISGDELLGVQTDELGIEVVRAYRIRRPAGNDRRDGHGMTAQPTAGAMMSRFVRCGSRPEDL
jgi:hypothetical protein